MLKITIKFEKSYKNPTEHKKKFFTYVGDKVSKDKTPTYKDFNTVRNNI